MPNFKSVTAQALIGALLFVTAGFANAQQRNCQPDEGLMSQAIDANHEMRRAHKAPPRSTEDIRQQYLKQAMESTLSVAHVEGSIAKAEADSRGMNEVSKTQQTMIIAFSRMQLSVLRCKQGGGSTQSAQSNQSTTGSNQQSGQQSGQQSNQNLSERDVSRGQSETAQKSQAEAEKRRAGQRRRHEPEAEAHNCISLDRSQALYGGFVNSCNFKVEYTWCAYRPKKGSWAETTTSCEEGRFGSWSVGPGNRAAGHTKNAEMIYWFACKSPAWALDVEFAGSGVKGRCQTVGGK